MRIKIRVLMALIAGVAAVLGAERAVRRRRGVVYPPPACAVRASIPEPGVIAIEATATLINPSRESAVFRFQATVRRLTHAGRAVEVWSWEPAERARLSRGGIGVMSIHGGQGIPITLPRGAYLVTVLVREDVPGPAMVACGDSALVEVK
jgi:hypothetical protein